MHKNKFAPHLAYFFLFLPFIHILIYPVSFHFPTSYRDGLFFLSSCQQWRPQITGLDLLSSGLCSLSKVITPSDQPQNPSVFPFPADTLIKKISPWWASNPESPFFASR